MNDVLCCFSPFSLTVRYLILFVIPLPVLFQTLALEKAS